MRRFSEKDDRLIRRMVEVGRRDCDIAKRLDRSHSSVLLRRRRLGLKIIQKNPICGRCNWRKKKPHHNARWCVPCAEKLKHRPVHRLTTRQQQMVRRLAGTMSRDDLAERIGVSLSSVRRFCRDEKISLNFVRDYTEKERREVSEFYARHGRAATQKRFPHVKVRSIVERYLSTYGNKRQIRWTGKEMIELARMGGIISAESQALYFNRPGAHAGSISSVWMKRFGLGGGVVPGLSLYRASQLVDGARKTYAKNGVQIHMPFEPLVLPYWRKREVRNPKKEMPPRRIYLWVDIADNVRKDLPKEVRDAVMAMGKFQRWLYGTENVRHAIGQLIRHREKGEVSGKRTHKVRKQITRSGGGKARAV